MFDESVQEDVRYIKFEMMVKSSVKDLTDDDELKMLI